MGAQERQISYAMLRQAILAEFYQYMNFENISSDQIASSVRKVVEGTFVASLPMKLSNSTIDLIANATFQRYMSDIDFTNEMPEVVYRLQNVRISIRSMR